MANVFSGLFLWIKDFLEKVSYTAILLFFMWLTCMLLSAKGVVIATNDERLVFTALMLALKAGDNVNAKDQTNRVQAGSTQAAKDSGAGTVPSNPV